MSFIARRTTLKAVIANSFYLILLCMQVPEVLKFEAAELSFLTFYTVPRLLLLFCVQIIRVSGHGYCAALQGTVPACLCLKRNITCRYEDFIHKLDGIYIKQCGFCKSRAMQTQWLH
ncbi:hypothetical protein EV361DRAFT_43949 [Lentinula raphanica]|nr:hypothetical protein EV361DRAFT_43949 [Lentinula raphanica]